VSRFADGQTKQKKQTD